MTYAAVPAHSPVWRASATHVRVCGRARAQAHKPAQHHERPQHQLALESISPNWFPNTLGLGWNQIDPNFSKYLRFGIKRGPNCSHYRYIYLWKTEMWLRALLPPIFCILVIPTDAVFDTISFVFDTINFVSLTKPRKMSGFYPLADTPDMQRWGTRVDVGVC